MITSNRKEGIKPSFSFISLTLGYSKRLEVTTTKLRTAFKVFHRNLSMNETREDTLI